MEPSYPSAFISGSLVAANKETRKQQQQIKLLPVSAFESIPIGCGHQLSDSDELTAENQKNFQKISKHLRKSMEKSAFEWNFLRKMFHEKILQKSKVKKKV